MTIVGVVLEYINDTHNLTKIGIDECNLIEEM